MYEYSSIATFFLYKFIDNNIHTADLQDAFRHLVLSYFPLRHAIHLVTSCTYLLEISAFSRLYLHPSSLSWFSLGKSLINTISAYLDK